MSLQLIPSTIATSSSGTTIVDHGSSFEQYSQETHIESGTTTWTQSISKGMNSPFGISLLLLGSAVLREMWLGLAQAMNSEPKRGASFWMEYLIQHQCLPHSSPAINQAIELWLTRDTQGQSLLMAPRHKLLRKQVLAETHKRFLEYRRQAESIRQETLTGWLPGWGLLRASWLREALELHTAYFVLYNILLQLQPTSSSPTAPNFEHELPEQ